MVSLHKMEMLQNFISTLPKHLGNYIAKAINSVINSILHLKNARLEHASAKAKKDPMPSNKKNGKI